MFINDHIYYTKNGGDENSPYSERNGKLPLPQWKQGNYLVITIYVPWNGRQIQGINLPALWLLECGSNHS